jgi:hypothetical protein
MLSRRILFCSVVRFSPRRSAAAPGPEIRPDVAFNASMIACRSASWNVDTGEADRTHDFFSLASGTFNSSPCVKMTARSMKFSNSRTLPGYGALVNASIAGFGIDLMRFCIRLDNRETK